MRSGKKLVRGKRAGVDSEVAAVSREALHTTRGPVKCEDDLSLQELHGWSHGTVGQPKVQTSCGCTMTVKQGLPMVSAGMSFWLPPRGVRHM